MIQTLVISGGGPNFLAHLGILQKCFEHGILDMSNIVSCYATSAGTMPCMLLAMRIPITEIADYFIQRPWDKWLKFDAMIFDMKCMCDSESLREAMKPFFNAYDVPLDVTFTQFHERFGVDLHFFASAVDTLESVDFCKDTQPDLSIVDAAIMSSSIPPLYRPLMHAGRLYMDGGFTADFPVTACLQKTNPENVLAISNDYAHLAVNGNPETAFSLFAHVMNIFISNSTQRSENDAAARRCKHFIPHSADSMFSPDLWQKFFTSPETRSSVYEAGRASAQTYFTSNEHC